MIAIVGYPYDRRGSASYPFFIAHNSLYLQKEKLQIVSKNKNPKSISKKYSATGDCFKTVGDFALGFEFADFDLNRDSGAGLLFSTDGAQRLFEDLRESQGSLPVGDLIAVHGAVIGRGDIEGVEFSHAWIEDDVFVYDYSNGNSGFLPKGLYYQLGGVQEKSGKLKRYTFKELRNKMVDAGFYGNYEIITESGY